MTDAQLIASVARRCPDAFEALYDRYIRLAFSLAVRILGDTEAAEEAVQEVFLAVWRRAATYQAQRGSVRTWLCSIVHHRALDRCRGPEGRIRAALPLDCDAGQKLVTDPWDAVDIHVAAGEIRQALDALPAAQRDVIELAYFAGYSQTEISDLLCLPLGTVKSRARLALRKLQAVA